MTSSACVWERVEHLGRVVGRNVYYEFPLWILWELVLRSPKTLTTATQKLDRTAIPLLSEPYLIKVAFGAKIWTTNHLFIKSCNLVGTVLRETETSCPWGALLQLPSCFGLHFGDISSSCTPGQATKTTFDG